MLDTGALLLDGLWLLEEALSALMGKFHYTAVSESREEGL